MSGGVDPMDYLITPSPVRSGECRVPGDKSISHRALMLSALTDGISEVRGFLDSEDCLATRRALIALGVNIGVDGSTVKIEGVGSNGFVSPVAPLDLGNSGTGLRLLTGLLCGQRVAAELTGDSSLRGRPMSRIIDPLVQMGALIESHSGCAPLRLASGDSLVGINYVLPMASAQVKSAILLAGLGAKGPTTVTEPAPTRDHTERMLAAMGADIERKGGSVTLVPGKALQPISLEVPGDLSSAAFIIAAALLGEETEIVIRGVGVNPTRTGMLAILQKMGADVRLENERLAGQEPIADIRARSSVLNGIEVDPALVSLAIDEFPILFALAACASGETVFSGLAELRVKESDRIAAMADGLRSLGITVMESDDGARIIGGSLSGGVIDSRGDHRIAMSFAIIATRAAAPVRVRDVANVATSFPGFANLCAGLGVSIEEI
jgi:3-phosphoshikimate 1-carboxyvinyltransferase